MPNSFATTPEGLLFVASGMDPMIKWDGLESQAVTVGVAPPSSALVISGAGSGSISGTYTAYQRFVDKYGNFSNLSPISNEVTVTNVGTISYTSVPVPTDPKVARRQILRNTSGQAETYYVDVDTTNLASTSFSSTRTDSQLDDQPAVPILNPDGSLNANRYGVPPNHKAVIAHHLGRMFAAGEVEYRRGCVQVTFGSTAVTGVGTEWTSSLAGRFLYVDEAPESYEIVAVDVAAQTLTLSNPYQGTTDRFASYGIRPAPAERRLVYFSEAGLPEAWPAVNAISLQEDGDEITGLMPKGSFLYVLERRHIYRFTFQSDPSADGFVFLSGLRGCLNHRCWVIVEDMAYMLDEQGIHAFSGGQESEPISTPIQGMFRHPGESFFHINWRASSLFHAVHFPQQETIRWFVSLGWDYLPRHAIAYNYRLKSWWLEEYAAPVGASALGSLNGQPQVYLGGEAKRVLALWQGALDLADPAAGTVRGMAAGGSLMRLTDTRATFDAAHLPGTPVAIVGGRGKGQLRTIVESTPTEIVISHPWSVAPDSTSIYQVGAINWRYRSGWFRFVASEQLSARRLEVGFEPCDSDCTMAMRIFLDRADEPMKWDESCQLDDGVGVGSEAGDPDLTVDLAKDTGFVQHRIDGHKDFYLDGPRYMCVELGGFTSESPVAILHIGIDGVVQ